MSIKTLALCLPLAVGFASCQAFSDRDSGTRKSDADPVEVMSQTEMAARLGPEHEKLAALAGNWNLKYRQRSGPNAQWADATGTASARLVLDGRFLVEELNTTYGGQSYKGVRVHGFDNLEKTYFNIWFDTLGTWPVLSRGTVDDNGVVRYIGRWKDIHTPAGRPFRTIATQKNNDEWVLEMYDTIDGEEVKVVEATYTRRK